MSAISKKIVSLARLKPLVSKYRRLGKKIVFTNGTFDLLHRGHVTYLEKAKESGDILIVGVNSDNSVKTYKAPDRPINPEQDRLFVLAALQSVDYVILFGEPTPLNLILALKPHILVKGADWKGKPIAGAKEIKTWGGQVKLVDLVEGRSTTAIIDKMKR